MSLKRKIKSLIHKMIMLSKEKIMIPIPSPVNTNELLSGKIALITGGSSGIGFETAKSFLRNGAKVIIAGTNHDKLKNCTEKLNAGDNLKFIVLNVLEAGSLDDKVIEAANMFNENRIDILVNSAGVNSGMSFENVTPQEFERIMNINVRGTYFMSRAVGEFMIAQKIRGHILNLASASSLRPGITPYIISKWAIRGMTIGLADYFINHGITVNAIAPGPVATPMLNKHDGDNIYNSSNPAGRFAMPSEIAELAVFMVSSMGDLIVGDTYFMTGGGGVTSLHR